MLLLLSLEAYSVVVGSFVKVVENIRQQREHHVLRLLKAIFICLDDVSDLMWWFI